MINEVQYDPVQGGTDVAFEWLELLNRTGGTVDLTGWGIADNNSIDYLPSLLLAPGDFAVIAAGSGFYDNFTDFTGDIVFVADGSIGNGLNNGGDRLILTDFTDRVIDALSYGDDTSVMLPSCLDVSGGHSLERQPAGLDTDHASDFVDNGSPSPGDGLEFATPAYTPVTTMIPPPTSTPIPSTASTPTPKCTAAGDGDNTPTASASPPPVSTCSPILSAIIGPSSTNSPDISPSPGPSSAFGPTQTPAPDAGASITGIYLAAAACVVFAGITSIVVVLLRRRG